MAEATVCMRFRVLVRVSSGDAGKSVDSAFAELHYILDMPPTAGSACHARVNDCNTDRFKFRVFRMRCQDSFQHHDQVRRGNVSSRRLNLSG